MVIVGFFIIFVLLITSITHDIFIGYGLLVGYCYFVALAYHKGYSLKSIVTMSLEGGRKSYVVLKIFILVGGLTSIWMAAGTVQTITYYSIHYMNFEHIYIYAFLLCGLMAFLLGTSLGAVSTVGIIFMLIARSFGMDINLMTGAIISGAYLGDRTSPMASSANLVASLTNTDLHNNVKRMMATTLVPILITIVFYYIFRDTQAIFTTDIQVLEDIKHSYNLKLSNLIPAIAIFLLALTRTNVKASMFISILIGIGIAHLNQEIAVIGALKTILFGYQLSEQHVLREIFTTNGILGMCAPTFIIYISCALSGIFNTTHMLQGIKKSITKYASKTEIFATTILVSLFAAGIGCSQSITTVLTYDLMKDQYKMNNLSDESLALYLENTGVVLAPLLPWNIAAFVATSTLGVSKTAYIPFAFYLFILPLVNLLMIYIKEKFSRLGHSTRARAKIE